MSESFEVVTAALDTHARSLATLAGDLRAALDSARSVGMTSDAYGEAGQLFTAAITALAKAGHTALTR